MKFSLIYLTTLFLVNSFAAQNSIPINKSVEWESLSGTPGIKLRPVVGYWNNSDEIPELVYHTKISGDKVQCVIDKTLVEPLSVEEIKIISNSNIPDEFIFSVSIDESRKTKYARIEVNGIRKNNSSGTFEKLIGFEGNINVSGSSFLQQKSFVGNSAFASGSGSWYKIGVVEDGVYKIDYEFLRNVGVDVSSLSSDALNIFGNGVGMLSEDNSVYRYDDIVKNSIFVADGGDGTFDENDYLLFYGKGPHQWIFQGKKFIHESHKYCDTSYYYINVNTNSLSPKRIGNASLAGSPITSVLNSFVDYAFIEDDKHNLGKSGMEWYGDIYDVQTNYTYSFPMNNIVSTDTINVTAVVVAQSASISTTFTLSSDVTSVAIPVPNSGSGSYVPYGKIKQAVMNYKGSGNSINLQLEYDKNGSPSARGWLDYIEVNATRNLIMNEGQMRFNNAKDIGAGNVNEFIIGNVSNISQIWEITDCRNATEVNYSANGSSASFAISSDSLRSFVAFNGNSFKTPTFFNEVNNQNLHGLGYADMIIIVPVEFISAANDLANFHLSHDGLVSHVVTDEQIYNEFSSGMRDVTAIRHFLKMFYDRAGSDPNQIPKYCLLMGDASYDPRNRLGHNSVFIPTFESFESLSSTLTYATDDYFGILSNSGSMGNSDLMDIAIGRLPAKSLEEANQMVNKIKVYSSDGNNGVVPAACNLGDDASVLRDWRNVVCLVSDDGDGNIYFSDTELMEDSIVSNNKAMNIVKIHSDAYIETSTPGGERNYGAEEAINQRVERGALLVNYIGHGGETGWAHERILTVPTIQSWTNLSKLPVFMTATCEFSRYDDHDRTSAGEYVVLNPNGGGIALFTTTRLVYNSSNRRLNKHFHSLFYDKPDGEAMTVGDIYFKTKELFVLNGGGDENFRKFTLLGDPAVKVALPKHLVVTDSVNGVYITSAIDTLKALSTITINGHLTDYLGGVLSGFNGVVYPMVYDKKSTLETLANSSGSSIAPFEVWKNIVYKGKATVKNGYFSFSFVVPQDISFQYGSTRISYYGENGSEDAQGSNEVPIIGGINTNAAIDEKGPEIQLFMNNENFVSGGITDENPKLYAKLFDENGINMVGTGIGHNIEAVLDENTSESIILNDYYEADLDSYKSGEVTYPFSKLETGNHTLSLKVWDVYNNSEKSTIEFIVAKSEKLALDHVLNYPNPFTTRTEFYFEHNQVCDYLDVQIQIFTISGKIVKSIDRRLHLDGFRSQGIEWNGLDDYGDKIGRGVYVYKLKVLNERGEKVEKFEKLVILN